MISRLLHGAAAVVALSLTLACQPKSETARGPDGPAVDLRQRPDTDVRKMGERDDVHIYYIPAYEHANVRQGSRRLRLVTTLHVRNASMLDTLGLQSVHYYDALGQLAYDFLKRPLALGPMQTYEVTVSERDTSTSAGSFLVEIIASEGTAQPIIESVMVGVSSNVGLSFTSRGVLLPSHRIPEALLH